MSLFKIKDLTSGDFDLYFKGSLIRLLLEESKPEWVWYDGCTPEGLQFRRSNLANSKFYLGKKEFQKYQVESKFPTGLFNSRTSVVLCTRIGQRQNLKGIQLSTNFFAETLEDILYKQLVTSDPMGKALSFSAKKSHFSPEVANFLFENPRYLSLKDAIIQLRSRKAFARALSSEYALLPHTTGNNFLVFYRDLVVAEVFSKMNKVRPLRSEFTQDLQELLVPQGGNFL